jgi:hypothetical protein
MEAVVTMQTQDRSPAPGFGEMNCFQFDFEIVGDQLYLFWVLITYFTIPLSTLLS